MLEKTLTCLSFPDLNVPYHENVVRHNTTQYKVTQISLLESCLSQSVSVVLISLADVYLISMPSSWKGVTGLLSLSRSYNVPQAHIKTLGTVGKIVHTMFSLSLFGWKHGFWWITYGIDQSSFVSLKLLSSTSSKFNILLFSGICVYLPQVNYIV